MEEIIQELIKDEGLRLKAYKCPAGKLTIGIGRNIDSDGKGISKKEAMMLLQNDIVECEKDLKVIFVEYDIFPKKCKHALINMRFNLGPVRFRGFKKLIAAIHNNDWISAANECLDSKAARDLPRRYERIADMLRNG